MFSFLLSNMDETIMGYGWIWSSIDLRSWMVYDFFLHILKNALRESVA